MKINVNCKGARCDAPKDEKAVRWMVEYQLSDGTGETEYFDNEEKAWKRYGELKDDERTHGHTAWVKEPELEGTAKSESYESDLEDIAQTSGGLDYNDVWRLDAATSKDKEIRKKVRSLIMDWREAAEDGDEAAMDDVAKELKALADSLPKDSATKEEASSTGKLKGRKNIMDAINRGYIFEALDIAHDITEEALSEVDEADEALAGCREQLDKLDKLRNELNEIGAAALRTSITNLYSPEHARDAARDKTLKEAVKLLYEIFGDLDAGREMVLTYTSSLATNAKKALLQNKNAIELTQQDLKDNGLKGDTRELVTFTSAKSRQANAGMAKELLPLIDQAKVVAEAAGDAADATVPAAEYKKLLDKLSEMYANASKVTMVITTTPDFQASDVIKQLKTAPDESKVNEGFLDKLIDMFKRLASGLESAFASLKKTFTDLFSDVEEANETYEKTSQILMDMGFAPVSTDHDESKTESLGYATMAKKLKEALKAMESDPYFDSFTDELFYANEALSQAHEALDSLKESLVSLKGIADSAPKNEGNVEVIGVLADTISQIVADIVEEEGEFEDTGMDDDSVADQVSAEYRGDEGGEGEGEGEEAPMP